jgi:hypothetical protein
MFGNVLDQYTPAEVQEGNERREIEAALQSDARAQELRDPTWMQEVVSPLVRVEADKQKFDQLVTEAARSARVDTGITRRLFGAAISAPEDERAIRFGPFSALEPKVARRGVYQGVIPQLDHTSATDAARMFKGHLDKYGDEAKAFAAYWGGEAAVDAAIRDAGDAWLDTLPAQVRNFVYRAQSMSEDAVRVMPPSDPFVSDWEQPIAP